MQFARPSNEFGDLVRYQPNSEPKKIHLQRGVGLHNAAFLNPHATTMTSQG
jgi:hypothetical protein